MAGTRGIVVSCVLLGLSFFPGLARPGLAEEVHPAVEFSLPFYSAYVSRGQVTNDDPVSEPDLTIAIGSFSVNLWGNFDLTDRVIDGPGFSEVDLTLEYEVVSTDVFSASVGFVEYTYPNVNDSPTTREIFLASSLPELWLEPTAEMYVDVDEADGAYLTFALAHEFALAEDLSLRTGASAGWGSDNYNEYFFARDTAALNDGNVFATLAYSFSESVELSGLIAYMWLWDSEIREGANEVYFDEQSLWGGVALACSF